MRVFVRLVNNREYKSAEDLAAQFGLRDIIGTKRANAASLQTADHRDTMFCLAVLDTQRGGNPERACADFTALRAMLPAGHHLI